MDRLGKIKKCLSKASSYEEKMRSCLQDAVNLALEGKGFTEEEKRKFAVSMASGFEEIVTYNNKGEYLEISVTELNAMPSDAIREVFNIDNNV